MIELAINGYKVNHMYLGKQWGAFNYFILEGKRYSWDSWSIKELIEKLGLNSEEDLIKIMAEKEEDRKDFWNNVLKKMRNRA